MVKSYYVCRYRVCCGVEDCDIVVAVTCYITVAVTEGDSVWGREFRHIANYCVCCWVEDCDISVCIICDIP